MVAHHAKDGSWIIQARFPHAREVFVLGSFNNWSTTATRLRPVGEGVFETQLTLPAGASTAKASSESAIGAQVVPAPVATSKVPELWDICFFVWEWGQRLGHLVRLESESDGKAAILPA